MSSAGRLWSLDAWPNWAPMASGAILAAGFWHAARETAFGRYGVFAAASLGVSLFFWLFPFGPRINPSDRLTLSLFVIAAVLMAAGGVTIARFRRTRPELPVEAGDGR
jgi:hypothetical protein